MIQEERFRTDSKLFRELAEDAYHTCVSAVDALHALLREHDEDSDHESECECNCGHEHEDAVVAAVAEASDHDCGAAHPAAAKPQPEADDYFRRMGYPDGWTAAAPVVEAAHLPEVGTEDHPGAAYFRGRGYPEGQIQMMKKYWAAYKMGKEVGRKAELEYGGWATLGAGAKKKRVMIYKGHAFEPPCDRDYAVPGPLKHLGKYNRAAKRIDRLAPGEVVPVVPQTAEDYPWWQPRASRVSA